jgi:hypothetical protein
VDHVQQVTLEQQAVFGKVHGSRPRLDRGKYYNLYRSGVQLIGFQDHPYFQVNEMEAHNGKIIQEYAVKSVDAAQDRAQYIRYGQPKRLRAQLVVTSGEATHLNGQRPVIDLDFPVLKWDTVEIDEQASIEEHVTPDHEY